MRRSDGGMTDRPPAASFDRLSWLDSTAMIRRSVPLPSDILGRSRCSTTRQTPPESVVLRTLDLRSELEAHVRALTRLKEQIRKTSGEKDTGGRELKRGLRHELDEMLRNNLNIRDVLTPLEAET
jgi:hypothetical protein